jgi:hypothetical protein
MQVLAEHVQYCKERGITLDILVKELKASTLDADNLTKAISLFIYQEA